MVLPKRKRIRLENFDYSAKACYFITLCVQNRLCLFERECVGNDLRVVPQNQIIHKWFMEMESKFKVQIEQFIIMPNHIHFIISVDKNMNSTLPEMMQWFKTMTTNEYIRGVKENGLKAFDKKLWQKSYYEHIIRDENDYKEKLQYITGNYTREDIIFEW